MYTHNKHLFISNILITKRVDTNMYIYRQAHTFLYTNKNKNVERNKGTSMKWYCSNYTMKTVFGASFFSLFFLYYLPIASA